MEAYERFDDICEEKKQAHLNNSLLKLNSVKNSKEFWSIAKSLNNSPAYNTIKANLIDLKLHFSRITNSQNNFSISHAVPLILDNFLDNDFDIAELNHVFDLTKDNKAAGTNRIPSEFYKYMHHLP